MYKAIIIGAGPGGYSCAIRIAQLGGTVLLIERDLVGGICINWGCTPSKAMISSAKAVRSARKLGEYGITADNISVDFPKVAQRRDEIIARSRTEIKNLLNQHRVELVEGNAELVDNNTVRVGEKNYQAENIVLATGSEPLIPAFLQKVDSSIVNSNKIITINDLPESMTIVGGGIIGLELATLYSYLGTKVRVVELLPRCIAIVDEEISAAITNDLIKNGVEILTEHKVLDITEGKLTVEKVATAEKIVLDSPLNLIAIGRKAVINEFELTKLNIAHTAKGIIVDEYLRTNIPNIYSVGDSTGLSILAHVAIQQGIIAAENINNSLRKMNYSVIPAVIYTLPEVSIVGTLPKDLTDIKVYKYPFSANLRANIEGRNQGFVKLWVSKENKLLAAQLVGEEVSEIVQSYANVIALDLKLDEVANIIHAHPTYNEIVRNSFEYVLGRAIEYIQP